MENTLNKDRGTLLWRFSQKFQFAADKIIPDSLVFCLILTFIVYLAALIFTDKGPVDLCLYWFNHAWDMLAFSMQMSMMVVVCAATAKSRPVNKGMGVLARALNNPILAMVVFMIWGYVASFINWAFCTLSCTVLAIELSKRNKGLSFPILLVGGYCTSCLGQCLGPTASVYALLATEGNYMQETLSVKDISAHVFLSASYVCTFFKNETGQTLNQYITEYRMERAKQLLGDSRYKIADISSRVGYSDGNYFGKSFK